MAFVSGALAVVTGCDKNTAPPPEPSTVVVGDPDPTTGLPTAAPSTVDSAPPPKIDPPPSTEIPETTCEGDRDALLVFKSKFDTLYAEIGKLQQGVSSCSVADESCVDNHKPLAKRFATAREQIHDLIGMCACLAPIVREYTSKHREEAIRRLDDVRTRVIDASGSTEEAGKQWDQLVRNEATPRPCLSCIRCEPRSACD